MSPPPPSIPLPHELAAEEATPGSASRSGSSLREHLPSRGTVLRVLTMTQNTSAMAFSVFLLPHLASPIVASLAGLQGAEKTMMIARDLYLPLEPVLVYIPITVHLVSSLLRRLVTLVPSSTETPDTRSKWSWRSLRLRLPRQTHQIIAYPLTILVLSHILTHRLIPSSPRAPISTLSPSELGWEFVGYNLRSWSAWAGYLALVGMGTWHACVGGMKVVSWLKPKRSSSSSASGKQPERSTTGPTAAKSGHKPSTATTPPNTASKAKDPTSKRTPNRGSISFRRKIGLRGLIVLFLGIISVGLGRVASDTGLVSGVMKRRYDAVLGVKWAGFGAALGAGWWR